MLNAFVYVVIPVYRAYYEVCVEEGGCVIEEQRFIVQNYLV